MDQIKIGKFIAECRKSKNLTQFQLSEMLNITDRAVSKWECGKSMPDCSIMLELCDILGISVNDLLCGEVVTMDNYKEKSEQNLFEAVKEKEEADKRLLRIEIILGCICVAVMLVSFMFAAYVELQEWQRITFIPIGLAPFLAATPFMIRIEQMAGYYECRKCGHRHIPKYNSVFFAMHYCRTRYMKCPKCEKRSWQKKVISKNN